MILLVTSVLTAALKGSFILPYGQMFSTVLFLLLTNRLGTHNSTISHNSVIPDIPAHSLRFCGFRLLFLNYF